jgi:hypothetical protein
MPRVRTQTAAYISVAETAKLIRAALKQSFPATRFHVRSKSYSGGASIQVAWTDGPVQAAVEQVTQQFEGASFDLMQDLKTYPVSQVDGKPVRFGADYIFTSRNYSDALIDRAISLVAHKYGVTAPTVDDFKWGRLQRVQDPRRHLDPTQNLQQDIRNMLVKLENRHA